MNESDLRAAEEIRADCDEKMARIRELVRSANEAMRAHVWVSGRVLSSIETLPGVLRQHVDDGETCPWVAIQVNGRTFVAQFEEA